LQAPVSSCTPAELPGLLDALDMEFVFGRGRKLSLAERFPEVFAPAHVEHLLVAREQGRIVASIAVRNFRWLDGGDEHAGAMIGMVWTDPASRGRGLASLLLGHLQQALAERADFAVLWTAQPQFYARLGWIAADCASFGTIEGTAAAPHATASRVEFTALESIWRQQPQRVARPATWQPPLPLPAEALEFFRAGDAYAIAGRERAKGRQGTKRSGDKLYCYEILGSAAAIPALLANMRARCGTLHFNERTDSAAYRALAGLGVAWEVKPLAMWLPLRAEVASAALGWYVPWLDRI
jgi:predicted N-acetyltransferase YhbS